MIHNIKVLDHLTRKLMIDYHSAVVPQKDDIILTDDNTPNLGYKVKFKILNSEDTTNVVIIGELQKDMITY